MRNMICCVFILMVGLAVKADILPLPEVDKWLYSYSKPVADSDYMTYDFNDFEDPRPTTRSLEKKNDCFPTKVACDKKLNRQDYKLVCAYNIKYGLMNYFSACEINLQICLLKLQNNDNSMRRQFNYGELYYNGLSHPCDYYQSHTTTGKEAIELYHKLGIQYNSN